MSIAVQFQQAPSSCGQAKTSRLHQRTIGFVKIVRYRSGAGAIRIYLFGVSVGKHLRAFAPEINGVYKRFVPHITTKDEEQFLTLIADRHHMHLAHRM